ncbi:hypothetical protein ACJIZ3_004723 [Penstemon smallii]|uniref:Pentatricopeptide repeat-containing protein n=1 Tax=Penstemon smallii TaxID=265156 RepID=A0ABD3S340_9LAMI
MVATSHVFPLLDQLTAKWNSNIRQALKQGNAHRTLLLFCQMKQQSQSQPNNLTFPFVAKACANLSNLKFSQIIHAQIVKTPYISDIYVQTALIDMYVKCGRMEYAHYLFDGMSERDVASWNTIIMGFAQLGFFDRVSSLFNRLRVEEITPDAVTLLGLTHLVSGMKDVRLLSGVHCFGFKSGFGDDVSVSNTWISSYAKCGDLCSAEMVFCSVPSDSLTVVSWNAMISGCACDEESMKAVGVYKRMLWYEYKPDLSTILNLLSSFAQPNFLHYGTLIHAHGVKLGCDSGITLLNTLISMYSKCGDINSARYIFDCMKERTCVTWTVMIGGYSERGDLDEALSLFHAMEATGEITDLVTVIHMLAACGKVGALETGKWIDNYTISSGLKSNLTVCNALLDMYMKCGSLRDAQELFLNMKQKTVVSWTTMIAGFALNGKCQESSDCFNQMLKKGLEPNRITFVAVLQACTHGGYLDRGKEIFRMMTQVFRINPGLDHYACMTDLLGRQGKLKEALKFILDMPVKPDAGIWGALLGACKIHKNLEIGEYAASRLFQLEPFSAAPYVEMANIYASVKEWEGVASMRMEMKNKNVTKCPGQSVVQVNGKCHLFTVEDRCHSEGFEIFEILDSLVLQLKDEVDYFCNPNEILL